MKNRDQVLALDGGRFLVQAFAQSEDDLTRANAAITALTPTVVASWLPADNSGASLALVITYAGYRYLTPTTIFAYAMVTFPATASGAAAAIIGLPTAVSQVGATIAYTDYGSSNVTIVLLNTIKGFNFYNYSGGQLTNANLSGKTFQFSVTFVTA
jgi:hypothetical protein